MNSYLENFAERQWVQDKIFTKFNSAALKKFGITFCISAVFLLSCAQFTKAAAFTSNYLIIVNGDKTWKKIKINGLLIANHNSLKAKCVNF